MATATKVRHVANRGLVYGGLALDRGQVFELKGALHDEKLTRLRYVREFDKGSDEELVCAECGAPFVSLGARQAHGQYRHPKYERTPDEQDEADERRELQDNLAGPIAFELTTASQKG